MPDAAAWNPFEPPLPQEDKDAEELARAAGRLFATPDGRRVMAHLHHLTTARALGPDAGDARLRHLEGQRALVLMLDALAARGRQ